MNHETTRTAMVIELAGKQFVAEPGSHIVASVSQAKEGETVTAKDLLSGKEVQLRVLKSFLGEKIRGLKFKNKIRYTRRYGHRQQLVRLEVVGQPTKEKAPAKVAAKPKAAPKAKTVSKTKAGKK